MRPTHIVQLVAASIIGGCSPAVAQNPAAAAADSLVLERTMCFGTCPAYRLSLTADGRVTFASRNPGDSTRAADSVSPATLAMLVRRAASIGFFALPERLRGDARLCAELATDHPTATLSIFGPSGVKVVEDYHGCYARGDQAVREVLVRLRAFETAVDSATGSSRWVRPARFGRARPRLG